MGFITNRFESDSRNSTYSLHPLHPLQFLEGRRMQALLILTLTLALNVNGMQIIQNQRVVETAVTSKLTNRPV